MAQSPKYKTLLLSGKIFQGFSLRSLSGAGLFFESARLEHPKSDEPTLHCVRMFADYWVNEM